MAKEKVDRFTGEITFVRPVLRAAYDDHSAHTDETAIDCSGDPGRTQQSFAEEVDINTIVRRFGVGAPLPPGPLPEHFGDFGPPMDFQTAMNRVVQARESFDRMPAAVRSEFDNDAGRFVSFCQDPGNFDQLEKWGLVTQEASDRRKRERLDAAEAAYQAETERRAKAQEKSQDKLPKGG